MNLAHDWRSIWLVLASLLAGTLNAVAGGGSFLSFPALLGMGVLPIQANATNAVALWPGQVASIAAFREDLRRNLRLLIPIGTASVLGGLGGGIMLLHTGQQTFLRLVPWLLLVAALLFAVSGPVSRLLQRRALRKFDREGAGAAGRKKASSLIPLFVSLLIVCFYVGYFGAGAGFLVMSLLAIFGVQDINEINALKVCVAALANGTAVTAFIIAGRVAWRYCLLMMIAAAIGGYLGGRYSRKLNPAIGRVLVVVIGLGMAAYFFWKQR
ncbi:MAG TPA: sulfite exporter TauE/SafE family protein [Acidisarcina sp.]